MQNPSVSLFNVKTELIEFFGYLGAEEQSETPAYTFQSRYGEYVSKQMLIKQHY